MKINFLKITLGLAFAAFAVNANAQKVYTQGVATYSMSTPRGAVESKNYFTNDSTAVYTNQGMFTTTVLTTNKGTYVAILVEVPAMSMKNAAVLTPDEVDQMLSSLPKFEFTPTTETKVINGFNCKKVTSKDAKGNTYENWVTNDIKMPASAMGKSFEGLGGVPVKFTTFQMGAKVELELKSIADTKAPAGMFVIPAGFNRITLEDLQKMGGKR